MSHRSGGRRTSSAPQNAQPSNTHTHTFTVRDTRIFASSLMWCCRCLWVVEGEKHTGNRTRTRGGPRTTADGDGQLLRLGEIFDGDDTTIGRDGGRLFVPRINTHTHTNGTPRRSPTTLGFDRFFFVRTFFPNACLFAVANAEFRENTNSTHSSGAPANSAVLHLVRLGAPNFILAFAAKANFLTHTGTSRTQNSSPSDTRFVMLSHFRSTSNAKLLFNMAENLDGECSHGASAREHSRSLTLSRILLITHAHHQTRWGVAVTLHPEQN